MAEDMNKAELPFYNTALPFSERVDDLLSRLSLEEKVGLLGMANPAIPRLGIPAYDWWNEALHGVARAGIATVFPQGIALAAMWDPELHKAMAEVISTEARAKHHDVTARQDGTSERYQGLTFWSPNINIFRDPRWGRGHETYGEDPLLSGTLGTAFVEGIQGEDSRYLKAVATPKHYAVHSGPESGRFAYDSVVPERDFRETYLPAFELCFRKGRAASVMSAYNKINGVPCCANSQLLEDILRDEWGFEGAVVGDVDNVRSMFADMHYTETREQTAAMALKAGQDLCSGEAFGVLPAAVEQGLAAEADVDRALRRLLMLRFRLGQFDPPDQVPYAQIPIEVNDAPEHDALALKAAQKSMVLLKNNGALPLTADALKKVAVIGPTADQEGAILGTYFGTPARPKTLLQGLQEGLGAQGISVGYERGCPLADGAAEVDVIKSDAMFTDSSLQTPGLRYELFTNPDFEGAPATAGESPEMDYFWNEAQPSAVFPNTDAVIRWSGVLVPPASGEFDLGVTVEGYVRLQLDGETLMDEMEGWWRPRVQSFKVTLEEGVPVPVRIDYRQVQANGKLQLGWQQAGTDLEQALALARNADHVLLTLGLTPLLEGEEHYVPYDGFHNGDRTSIQLPACQQSLLAEVSKQGKPVTVILTGGSAMAFDADRADAVVLAWYFGQRGADALVDILTGACNPSGRLPITFYRSDDDLPPFDAYAMTNRTYRYFTGRPLFAFGHGLSYTSFAYGVPVLSAQAVRAGESVELQIPVSNLGDSDGDEVVQVYAAAPGPATGKPIRQLVGFKRQAVSAGQTETVTIAVDTTWLRHWDDRKHAYATDPGVFQLQVGSASDNIHHSCELTVLP